MTDAIDKINEMRKRILAGEALTLEDSAEAIRLLVKDRAELTEKQEKAAAAIPINLCDLFKEKGSK